MVTVLQIAFQRWGLLIRVEKTKSMTLHVPMPGEEPHTLLDLSSDNQRIEHVNKMKDLRVMVSSGGRPKVEITRRIGQAVTAFDCLEKRGLWKGNAISRRANVKIYKATVLIILNMGGRHLALGLGLMLAYFGHVIGRQFLCWRQWVSRQTFGVRSNIRIDH